MINKKAEGFSLVELIIVIAIIGVLTGVLAPMYLRYVEAGRESVDIQNMDSAYQIAKAVYAEQDYDQNTYYWYIENGGEIGTTVPSTGYGKGTASNRGTTYAHPCCEQGQYDSSKNYTGKYLIITLPGSTESGDQTIHVHWSE